MKMNSMYKEIYKNYDKKHRSNRMVVTFNHYFEETQVKKKLMQEIALKAKVILIRPKQVIFKCFYVTN